ncbi:MAG: ABC transporter substrate-binding protein [Candidatus Kapabacteria bacterium]|nr:ABC transporter substrate-binding protein [Candidatus Kapabacteria bacterium]
MPSLSNAIGFVVTAFCLSLTFSCTKPGQPEGALRDARGGLYYGGIYRQNETGEIRTLDPAQINDITSSHVSINVYDQLVHFDVDLNMVPGLAKHWLVSEDGLAYSYILRTTARFHDDPCFPNGKGRAVTARDVLYSFTRICDVRSGSRSDAYFRDKVIGATEYYRATQQAQRSGSAPRVKGVAGFEAPNDTTFIIRLTKPFAPFEYTVTQTSMGIVPREAVEYYGKDFFQHPVGSGPFRFVSWTPDRSLVLKRNDAYWDVDQHGNRLPYLDGIRFSFIKDDKLQLLEFAAGNLEESFRIPNEFFADIVDENKKPKGKWSRFTLLHKTALSTQFYGMVTNTAVFHDARVRRAFNYAVDRNRIIRYVLKGQASGPAHHGLVPPSMPDYQTDSVVGYTFNPAKARAMLAEAGYPNGTGFPEVTLQLNAGGGRNVSIAEAIQGMLKEHLNVNVKLLQVEFAQHLSDIDKGKAPFYRLGWVADYPDPESFLNLYYGKLVPKDDEDSPINSTRYRNGAYDRLFEQALSTTDRTERMRLYRMAEQIAINDAPMLLILNDEDYRFVQPYVRNHPHNSMDRTNHHRTSMVPVR